MGREDWILKIIFIFYLHQSVTKADPRQWSCGGPYFTNPRVVGGQPVVPHSIPFQVGLVRARVGSKPFCGGSLISPWFVLTAAHCTHQSSPQSIDVLVGEHNYKVDGDGEIYVSVSEIVVHPSYNPATLDSDYSILRLARSVEKSPTVGFVCLPSPFEHLHVVGAAFRISGWGDTSEGGRPSPILRSATVYGISNGLCQAAYPNDYITENQICAANEGSDACQGDSGGPMTMVIDDRVVLAGIVSWGTGCARPESPGIYSRVSAQLQWIFQNTDAEFYQRSRNLSTELFKLVPDSIRSGADLVQCPDHYLLTSFRLTKNQNAEFRFNFSCTETNENVTQADKISEWSELKSSVNDSDVLEYQAVDCGLRQTGEDWILSSLKLDVDWERQTWRQMYTCNKVRMGRAVNCSHHETSKVVTNVQPVTINNSTTLRNVVNATVDVDSSSSDVTGNSVNVTLNANINLFLPYNFNVSCGHENGYLTKYTFKKKLSESGTTWLCWYEFTCCTIHYF